MSEPFETAAPPRFAPKASRVRRYVFWIAAAGAFAAAVVAALAPRAAGPSGLILLAGILVAGVVLLYALVAGEAATKWLRPDQGEGVDRVRARARRAAAFDALSDFAYVADRAGAPLTVNAAYERLAAESNFIGESGRPLGFERVLGAHPGIDQAVFRLNRAAKDGVAARETTPFAPFGSDHALRAFEIEVAPLDGGDVLWRARLIGADDEPGAGVAGAPDGLMDAAPVGFFAATPDGRIAYMNATLRSWAGLRADVDSLKLKDLFDVEPARLLGRGRRPGVELVRADAALKARDGISTPVTIVTSWPETDAKPLSRSIVYGPSRTGAPVGVAEALKTATASGESAATLDAMLSNAPFGVMRLDGIDLDDAYIADVNPAAMRMTDRAASPGARFSSLFDLSDPAAKARFRAADLDGAATTPVELYLTTKSAATADGKPGEPRCVNLYVTADRAGRRSAYLVEVSGQKTLERQLGRAQRLNSLGLLAGGVAHDMNNVLQAIVGFSDVILPAHPVGDPSYPALSQIKSAANKGAALVRQLLAFTGQQTVQPRALDLSASLSNSSQFLKRLLEDAELEVIHARAPYVKIDPGQFEQVLMNLVTNARDASRGRPNAKIAVRMSSADESALLARAIDDVTPGTYAVVSVEDQGSGMSPEVMERIFEPFFTTKPMGQGTGLGLSMVFGIIRQAGGHVLVDSEVGRGSTFHIFLPAYEPSAEELAEIETTVVKTRKSVDLAGSGCILLVEDEAPVRNSVSMNLEARGYKVLKARDALEALEILEREDLAVDLMICDVIMPGMSGPELLREARAKLGEAPVIFISGYAEQQFADVLANERNVHFLAKPFNVERLSAKIKDVLGRS